MADDQLGHTPGTEAGEHIHGAVALLDAHSCGRLVQQQKPAGAPEGTGNGHTLALAAGEAAHRFGEIRDLHMDVLEKPPGFRHHGFFVQKRSPHQLTAQEDVLHTVFEVVQSQILVHGADAQIHGLADGKAAVVCAADADAAAVRPDIAGQYFDEGGFAGTVVAYDGGDSAGLDFQRDPPQSLDVSETFCDPRNGENIRLMYHIFLFI